MATAAADKGMMWGIRLIGVMLVIALGYVVVKALLTFTNPESVWRQPVIAPASAQISVSGGPQNFNFTTDPFNRDVVSAEPITAEVGEDAPETTLNLKLTGRTTGPNGTAILRTPDNKEGSYRLDDEIVPGVTLQAVNRDFIVLNVDGQIQRLTFERNNETGLMPKLEDREVAPSKVEVKVPSGTAPKKASSFQSPEISGEVSKLFQSLSLRRVMKNGRLTGYSVKANRPGVDLSPFGFSKGDIVTGIGGTDVTRGRPDFLALFEQAAQNGNTEVTVLRNGQTRTIKLGTP